MTTTAFAPSLAPGVTRPCGGVRTNPQHSVSERGPQRARLENHFEYLTSGALRHLEGERARVRAFRRHDHEAPAGLFRDRAQRVEDRPARLLDRNDRSVVGKTTGQPATVRRG